MRIRSALDRWAARLDGATLDALGGVGSWLSLTIVVLLIVAVGAWIPSTARQIELEGSAALLAFVVPACSGLALAALHDKGRPYSKAEKVSTLWTSVTLQLFCVVLIARSSLLGSILFFPTLLFTAASHGFMYRSTLSEPFPTLGTLGATVVGMAICRTQEQALLLGLSGALAMAGSLYLGTLATRADRDRGRRDRMQAAIVAQQLHDRAARIRQLSESLVEVMANVHDMGNTLFVLRMSSTMISKLKASLPETRTEDIERIEAFLKESTGRLKSMIDDIQARRGTLDVSGPTDAEAVEITPIAAGVVETMSLQFPEASIESELEDQTRVEIAGGTQSLQRILENLVLNSLQGDGHRMASRVVLRSVVSDDRQLIIVDDDGPGFDEEQLSTPVTAFASGKPSGTGLGLYTVDRLVVASGGAMHRANRDEGGARVSIALRHRGPRPGRGRNRASPPCVPVASASPRSTETIAAP